MKPARADRPHLRLVDSAPRPAERVRPRPRSPRAKPKSVLARMIEAAEPGDFESLLMGAILGVLFIAFVIAANNFALIKQAVFG